MWKERKESREGWNERKEGWKERREGWKEITSRPKKKRKKKPSIFKNRMMAMNNTSHSNHTVEERPIDRRRDTRVLN